MTWVAAVSLAVAVVALVTAVGSYRFAMAPGWEAFRPFPAIAFTAGVWAAATVPRTLGAPDELLIWLLRLQMPAAGLHVAAWFAFTARIVGREPSRGERWAAAGALVLTAALIVPGVGYHPGFSLRPVEWLDVVYQEPRPTAVHAWTMRFLVLCFVYQAAVLARAVWRRTPDAGLLLLAVGLVLFGAVFDAAVLYGQLPAPYALGPLFVADSLIVGALFLRRFLEGAVALDHLSKHLEREVELRTRQLASTQEALMRAEKLAALGQVAAGVAHEINNPASAVLGNLSYLTRELTERGAFPADGLEALEDSMESVRRIAAIVRQLLDSGRVAGRDASEGECFEVRQALERAVAQAREARKPGVTIATDAPAGLFACGQQSLIEQVLVNLVVNAVDSFAGAQGEARVSVRAREAGNSIVLEVEDNGPGMSPELQRRVFEPFFTTKQVGKGTGLGLAVSLGIVRGSGGTIAVDSAVGRGTRMTVTLPRGEPGRAAAPRAARGPGLAQRGRVLLIDDEADVLAGLRRDLEGCFEVVAAGSVAEASAVLAQDRRFDLVLCDVMMPHGGAPAVLSELDRLAPELASRTALITGGAVGAEATDFLAGQSRPVLRKPVELREVLAMLDRLKPPPG